MDKDTTQAKLYEHYLSFFLPEGIKVNSFDRSVVVLIR